MTRSISLYLLCLLCLLVTTTGCLKAMNSPGGETATAYRQQSNFGWGADGAFTTGIDGSQTGSFTMAEGSIILNEDGTINQGESTIQSYLAYSPKADEISTGYAAALEASTAQQKAFMESMAIQMASLYGLIGDIVPLLAPGVASTQPQ